MVQVLTMTRMKKLYTYWFGYWNDGWLDLDGLAYANLSNGDYGRHLERDGQWAWSVDGWELGKFWWGEEYWGYGAVSVWKRCGVVTRGSSRSNIYWS